MPRWLALESNSAQCFPGLALVGIEKIMNPTPAVVLAARIPIRCSQSCGPDSHAATMDITAALVVYGYLRAVRRCGCCKESPPAYWGPRSFQGGFRNGVARPFLSFFHRVLLPPRSTLRRAAGLPLLLEHAVISGVFIWRRCLLLHESHRGAALGSHKILRSPCKMMAIGVVIHIFCVGLPIALVIRRYSMQ